MKPHPLAKFTVAAALLLLGHRSFAHCDSLDGPVVQAARVALDRGDLATVLIWVQPEDEAELAAAFQRTVDVRALGSSAKDLADTYFFETVVRLHRQGEGAAYTGLRPAETELGPAIEAADQALVTGSSDQVIELLTDAVQSGVQRHFKEVSSNKDFDRADVPAGRRYVTAYVEYVHYVERIYDAAIASADGHYLEHE